MFYLPTFLPLWLIPLAAGLATMYWFRKAREETATDRRQRSRYAFVLFALVLVGLACSAIWMYFVFDHWSGAEIARWRVVSALWQSLIPVSIAVLFQGIVLQMNWGKLSRAS